MDYIGTIERDTRLTREDSIIIYGAGKVGKHTLKVLEEAGRKGNVRCFCDNGKNMAGKTMEGISVCKVEEACTRYPQGTYLVSSIFVRQMVESLLQYGIEKIHIIRESPIE